MKIKNILCVSKLTMSGFLIFILTIFVFLFCACDGKTPSQSSDEQQNFDAAAFYLPNIVEVSAIGKFGEPKVGTGIIIGGNDSPIIATNLHVAGKHGAFISVRFYDESNFVNTDTIYNENVIEVLAYDEALDLCIFRVDYTPAKMYNDLTIEVSETQIVPFSSEFSLERGADIIAYGNALGQGIKKYFGKIVSIEQVVETEFGNIPLIQTTLATSNGCSGGAMFDERGRLLGITSFRGGPWGDDCSFSVSAMFVYNLYLDAMYESDSQISKLDWHIETMGNALAPTAVTIDFEKIDMKLKIENGVVFVSQSAIYSQYLNCPIAGFGKIDLPDSCTLILSQAMRYSEGGNGEPLKVVVEKDSERHDLVFADYKLKSRT